MKDEFAGRQLEYNETVKKYLPLTKQIFAFGLVGITTLLIDLSVTVILYDVVGLPAYLSTGIGFLSGFFFNFPMNRQKVFKHTAQDRFKLQAQVAMYIALCVFNLFTTSALAEVLVNSGLLTIGAAKVVLTTMIAIWNFVLFKTLIFSKNLDKTA